MTSLEELRKAAGACTACELSSTRRQAVFASGPDDARLLVLGEAPGASEDECGLPFVGRSGRLLVGLLEEELGFSREQVYIANAVKCRPPDNRAPRTGEIAACVGFLDGQLAEVAPLVVLTAGNTATRALLGPCPGITEIHGHPQISDRCSASVVPTFHPAAALRGGARVVELMRQDLAVVARLLEAA